MQFEQRIQERENRFRVLQFDAITGLGAVVLCRLHPSSKRFFQRDEQNVQVRRVIGRKSERVASDLQRFLVSTVALQGVRQIQ